jgi:regulatory protein
MSSFRSRRRRDDDTPKEPPKPGRITAIKVQQRDNARVSIYIDEKFAFGLHMDIQLDHRLKPGDMLDEATIATLLREDESRKAIAAALNLLSYRPRAAGELQTKLREKGYAPEAIDAAIARMRELRYLDDEAFAERWVESRQVSRPRSARMLKRELAQKGVDRDTIERTIEEAGVDEFGDALELARKKYESMRGLERDVRYRRLSGFLGRRGYGYDIIRHVMETLENPEDEIDDEPPPEP